MKQMILNNAQTVLAGTLSAASTSVVVANATSFGTPSPANYLLATLTVDGSSHEIVKVTGVTGSVLTVVRAQEGTAAAEWADGATVFCAATAASFERIRSGTPDETTNSVAIGVSASGFEANSNGVAIGRLASIAGAGGVAAGYNTSARVQGVAVGYGATTSYGAYGIAVGGAATAGDYAVAIGANAQASHAASGAGNGVAVGNGAVSTTLGSVAIGHGAAAREYSVCIGRLATASGIYCDGAVAIGNGAVVTAYGVAVGRSSAAEGGVAIGNAANTSGGVAVGDTANATGIGAVAIAGKATHNNTIAIGYGDARASGALAFGGASMIKSQRAIGLGRYFVVPADDWSDGSEHNMAGAESVVATPHIDLSGGEVWAASTGYTHGDVVRPTVANGYQYRLWCYDSDYESATMTSGASEPTWPTSVDDSVAGGGDGWWICKDLAAGYQMSLPAGMTFYPSEIMYQCERAAGITSAPVISVGTDAAPTVYLNAQTLNGLASQTIVRFPLTGVVPGCTTLNFRVDTAAVATRLNGRFMVRGVFIEDRGVVVA